MGFMDRFTKKKNANQLSQVGKVAVEPKPEAAPKVTSEAKKVTAESTKSPVVPSGQSPLGGVLKAKNRSAYHIVVRPLVTEKAAHLQSKQQYAFVVSAGANKIQIKQAVKDLYQVDPVGVNVINVQGKRLRFGKGQGKRSDFKKAIVTLPAGQSITMHEGV